MPAIVWAWKSKEICGLQPWIKEVCDRNQGRRPSPVGAEEPLRQPEKRHRAGAHDGRLDHEEPYRGGVYPVERYEGEEQQVGVVFQAAGKFALLVGSFEDAAVGGVPDGLVHVTEVEAGGSEDLMFVDRETGEQHRVHYGAEDNYLPGRRLPELVAR